MRKKQSLSECKEHAVKCLSWKIVQRDDKAVAKELYESKTMDAVYTLEDVTLVDELFYFIRDHLGLLEKWEEIQPNSIERVMIPFHYYLMVYLLKIVYGICYLEPVADVLFKNEALMKLVGFNAYQIANGICNRGKDRVKNGEPSAPICVDTLGDNIVKLPHQSLESLFNGAIRALAAVGTFGKKITGIIDTSLLETTKNFSGCGKTARNKEVWSKKEKKVVVIPEELYGFKVAVLLCSKTKIVLSVKFGKIEESDNSFLRKLIEQGIKNLSGYAEIKKILIDRGFLDGEDLWWLHKDRGIKFVVPAKKNMNIVGEVHELAALNDGEYIFREERVEKVRLKAEDGKSRLVEGKTSVIGVSGLSCYEAYGPEGHEKKKNRKDFIPNPINAVWVTAWAKRPNQTAEKGPVYLTNMPVNKPMKVLDDYDDRSLIEDGIFRTGKQDWNLKHPPKRTGHAFKVHVYLTLMMIALTTAFREFKIKEEEKDKRGLETGIERYRRKIVAENMNKVIVFIGCVYGIFYTYELSVILGGSVKDCEETMGLDYKSIIFQKYDLPYP
jgi:hypothetical protein